MDDFPVWLLLGFVVAALLWYLWREIVIAVVLVGTALMLAGLFSVIDQVVHRAA
jgi:uncharacterized membrane protein